MNKNNKKAIFLDRDGTINVEMNYIKYAKDVQLIPGAAQAIAKLNSIGLSVIVISNQSGLARGYFTYADLTSVQIRLNQLLKTEGAKIDAYYFCPHHPKGIVKPYTRICDCRKPAPGLIWRAAEEIGLELTGSFLVGDRLRDIVCGRSAGLICILVRTGHNDGPPRCTLEQPDYIADDLGTAVEWILSSYLRRAGENPYC